MKLMVLKPEGSSYQMYDAICEKIVSVGFDDPLTVYCKADPNEIAKQMRLLSKKCDILIVTGEMGGQGCARLAASAAFGHSLAFSDKAWEHIQRKCTFSGLDAAEFKNCAKLPQYSMPVTGSGIIPACFSVNDDLALLMFDEKLDQKLLERFESLLLTLCSSAEPEPEPEPTALPAPVKPAAKPAVKRRKPSASQAARAKSRRKYIKRTRRNAMILIGFIVFSAVLIIAAACSLLSDIAENSNDDKDIKKASVTVAADSKVKDKSDKKDKEKEDVQEKKPQSSSKPAEPASEPASSAPVSSEAPASSAAPIQQPAPSEAPPPPPVESAAPQPSYAEVPITPPAEQTQSSQSEEVYQPEEHVTMEYIYTGEEEEEDAQPSGNTQGLPTADRDAFDEKLSYTTDRGTKRMNAYDLVCQILMNETNGLFEHEALKAHAVATYSMLKYNNERGTAPSVLLKSNVTESIEDAVSEVLGVAAYYDGEYANTVYHSTSSGKTTSSESVWGGAFPYLVSVKSKYDDQSPYYETSYTVDSDKLARLVDRVYGIELDGDPDDWFEIKHDAPGGYVGTVIIGGETHGQGGTWGRKEITGRSFRENLLSYSIRSHCFDIEYDEDEDRFFITTYGYGHGVGMSQYGAHFMAQQGYNYVEILEHYYTGVEVY